MKVEFHDEYFVVVLGVLWVLCFLKPLLRCIGEGLAALSACLEDGCGCLECGPCLGVYGQHVLLLALFLQRECGRAPRQSTRRGTRPSCAPPSCLY